ncbi:hypothetical protein [Spelaeicoccus albus]|uniref:Putative nucleic acid-binding protein n=1 Tax=Spelaeicoccus albus TaxID=1280376 RepID=A0A7Z0ACW1_9MICO|nr:hypothetical protein [Spelaeicoccus albus]NYI67011.1 putative nucleic acid-binding protein [Spelaeicoccus albus]
MPTESSKLLLLDTNVLSPEKLAEHESWNGATLVTSSTSVQEVLGMQRPDREVRYRYALPVMEDRIVHHAGVSSAQFLRWMSEHAKHRPVSRQTDSLIVPASRLCPETRELGHWAISLAHETGQDRLFRVFASRALRRKQLSRIMDKWEFLREELDMVIPLDESIAACAGALANELVDSGLHVRGTVRNAMNDMYVAATSLTTGIPLATDDVQLRTFYRAHGWTVTSNDDLYIASPEPLAEVNPSDIAPVHKGDRYVNLPPGLRSRIDRTPPGR